MSFLSTAVPILTVIFLIIIEVLWADVSRTNNAEPVSQSTHHPHWGATPWPALGQRRGLPDPPNNPPSWVRPRTTQRHLYAPPNSAFNTGPQFGTGQNGASSSRNTLPAEVNDDELRELSEALLSKDVNNAARYVTMNLQGKTTSRSQRDEAPLPLLSVDQEAFDIPSIQRVRRLYDNYAVRSTVAEDYTLQEQNEENSLLDAIIETPVMQHLRSFLEARGKVGRDPGEFRTVLRQVWFGMYARGGRKVGSSGFEHVFLAEIKNNQVSGLHNWLYFREEEGGNRVNYLGYMKRVDLGEKGAILKYHFTLQGIDKPVGSMFIGTSPELEMALYTTCFLLRADAICPMKLKGNRFIIRTFTYRYKGKNLIGSAFPEI